MTILKQTKTAWIREPGHPIGKPALGYFKCQCGKSVRCPVYGQEKNVACECGQKYTGHGYLVEGRDEE